MDVKRVLQELIAISEQPETIASVYLCTRWADEHQREAVRVFLQDEGRRALRLAPSEEARQRLARTLSPIESYVSGLVRQRHDGWATGVALFSCAPIGFFRVIAGRMPFAPMEFKLGDRPYVLPMASTLGAAPPLLFATVDAEGGSLVEVSCGVVDLEAHIARPYPGAHARGGWSQRRFERHLGALRERNLRAVAEPFMRVAEARVEALLFVVGQSGTVRAFEELLPERIGRRIVARLPQPPANGNAVHDLLTQAHPFVEQAVRERHQQERDAALAKAARKALGVAGVAATLRALSEGSVHRLLVDRDYRAAGLVCQSCGALFEGPGACARCAGEGREVSFPEEIVRRAIANDAEVSFLAPEIALPAGTRLAALLRHGARVPQGHVELSPSS